MKNIKNVIENLSLDNEPQFYQLIDSIDRILESAWQFVKSGKKSKRFAIKERIKNELKDKTNLTCSQASSWEEGCVLRLLLSDYEKEIDNFLFNPAISLDEAEQKLTEHKEKFFSEIEKKQASKSIFKFKDHCIFLFLATIVIIGVYFVWHRKSKTLTTS